MITSRTRLFEEQELRRLADIELATLKEANARARLRQSVHQQQHEEEEADARKKQTKPKPPPRTSKALPPLPPLRKQGSVAYEVKEGGLRAGQRMKKK